MSWDHLWKARWFHENFIETFDTKQRESQVQMTLNFKPVKAGFMSLNNEIQFA